MPEARALGCLAVVSGGWRGEVRCGFDVMSGWKIGKWGGVVELLFM